MNRFAPTVLAALCLAAHPAQAKKPASPAASKSTQDEKHGDKDKHDDKKDTAGKPVQVGTFGDWGAYLAKGKNKTCYALASPKERKPDAKREAAFVFIADRPGEKVRNEVSIIMGFPLKETVPAHATIGRVSFDLVAQGANAWIKNPEEEIKFVEALQKGGTLVIKATAVKGPATTDTYPLEGLKPALARVAKDCK